MRRKPRNKVKKKIVKKRKAKVYSKKKSDSQPVDFPKVIDFKFGTLSKIYKNFSEKRDREKKRKEKLREKNREKQNKEEQNRLKEEERQLRREDEKRIIPISQIIKK